jgi:hypothetical protein
MEPPAIVELLKTLRLDAEVAVDKRVRFVQDAPNPFPGEPGTVRKIETSERTGTNYAIVEWDDLPGQDSTTVHVWVCNLVVVSDD